MSLTNTEKVMRLNKTNVSPRSKTAVTAAKASTAAAATSATLLACLTFATPAAAQNPSVTVGTGPVISTAGQPRTITVSGIWPNGCIPSAASVVSGFASTDREVVVTLTVPPPQSPCTLATAPFTVSTTFTPQATGVQTLSAISSNGQFVAKGELVTSSLTAQRALFDVSGVWYNPAVPGWGFSLTHAHAGSGGFFGTWYVYRADGSTKWYTLQDAVWDVPILRGVVVDPPIPQALTATVYESIGSDCPAAPQLIEACLVRSREVRNVGRITFTFTSRDTAGVSVERPPALGFVSLGPIQRIKF
jgi:hypothetical protein